MMKWVTLVAVLVVVAFVVTSARQSQTVELKEGDKAPNFSLAGSDGKTHSLTEMKGKPVVLAWFPKAFTGG